MRILSVTQLKDIEINGSIFPNSFETKIILDKKNPSDKKNHCLVFHHGKGDTYHCMYVNNERLLHLENKGLIEIEKANDNTRMSTN